MKRFLALTLLSLLPSLALAATLDVTQPPFNAVGEGVTNDSPAIQAAIDAASAGDTILLPTGKTFLVPGFPGLKVKSHLTISMYGATVKQGPNIGGSGIFGRNRPFENIPGSTEVHYRGGLLIGSRVAVGGQQFSIGIRFDSCIKCSVEDTTFEDWYYDGIYIGGNPPGSLGIRVHNVTVSNSLRNGMSIAAAIGVRITSSTFQNTNCSEGGTRTCTAFELNMPRTGIDFEPNNPLDIIDDVVVMDSTFHNNEGQGIFLQGKGMGRQYVFINNTFTSNKDIGLVMNQVSDVISAFNYVDGARIGISMGNNLRNVVLFGNEVKNTTSNGINVAGVNGALFSTNKVNGEKVAYINTSLMDALIGDVGIRPFN